MIRKLGYQVAILTTAALLLTACTGGSDPQEPSTSEDFIFATPAVPTSLDFMATYQGDSTWLQGYENESRLVQYSRDVPGAGLDHLQGLDEIEPGLAESWDLDDTGITFHLRKGVMSAAGNELNADDVVWTFKRGAEVSPIYALLLDTVGSFDRPDFVEAIDSMTVRFHIKQRRSLDLALFTYLLFNIYDSKTVLEHATTEDPWAKEWLKENLAFYGPWVLESFDPGQEIVYTANENYWDKASRGNVDRLIFRAIPESSTRSQLVRSGSVDYAERLTFQEYESLSSQAGFDVLKARSQNRDTIHINHTVAPFDNPLVRKAVSLAIDRNALAAGAYRGFATPSSHGVSDVFWDTAKFPSSAKFQYDPTEAARLLAEAGYAEGLSFELLMNPGRPGAHAEAVAIQVSEMLAAVGIDVKITTVASSTDFNTMFNERSFTAMLQLEPPALAAPYYSMQLYSGSESFLNTQGWKNARFDEIVSKVAVLLPGPELDNLLAEASDLMVNETNLIYLTDRSHVLAMPQHVSGYVHTPSGELFIYRLTVNAK